MSTKKGRHWTWADWETSSGKRWGANYATASILSAMVFSALLMVAIVLKEVAPTPPGLAESPLAWAKRAVAKDVFENMYFPDCEAVAFDAIREPFKSLAKKTGLFAPEAFAAAVSCLEAHMANAKMAPIETQLRSDNTTEVLFDISCLGDLKELDFCSRAFVLAKNKAVKVGSAIVEGLGKQEKAGR